ncbi:XRE family transcriptional regulator [Listeria monocytogenes]|nr:XRE family transcriptional regulator [Listeria monocytogenes]EAF0709426.1 XRE family transcriptional regulator [Listeria monocytogenes]EAF0727654.1 XRE family transcriptional regulator [Listeria monocytogenes]EAF0736774.1 XRE family transcriptional regulator [Listeria monocytogenes]EAF0807458.1 XRE family transcriptional regulator [Listeria monocytogenes]
MTDLNSILIKRIKILRKRLRLSQEKSSLAASLDARYVNKLKNGKFNLSVPTFDKLIEAFGMSYKDFFEIEKDNGLEKLKNCLLKKKRICSFNV